jgi:hypothetical protein
MGVGGGNFSSITLQTKLDWARVFFNSQVWNVLAVGGTTLVTP